METINNESSTGNVSHADDWFLANYQGRQIFAKGQFTADTLALFAETDNTLELLPF